MDLSNLENYKYFISQAGIEEIRAEMRRAKETYGKDWLAEFKLDFPDLTEIIDLAANYDAPAAFVQLRKRLETAIETEFESIFARIPAKAAAFGFLDAHRADIFRLHETLRAEIDKPRF